MFYTLEEILTYQRDVYADMVLSQKNSWKIFNSWFSLNIELFRLHSYLPASTLQGKLTSLKTEPHITEAQSINLAQETEASVKIKPVRTRAPKPKKQ